MCCNAAEPRTHFKTYLECWALSWILLLLHLLTGVLVFTYKAGCMVSMFSTYKSIASREWASVSVTFIPISFVFCHLSPTTVQWGRWQDQEDWSSKRLKAVPPMAQGMSLNLILCKQITVFSLPDQQPSLESCFPPRFLPEHTQVLEWEGLAEGNLLLKFLLSVSGSNVFLKTLKSKFCHLSIPQIPIVQKDIFLSPKNKRIKTFWNWLQLPL